MSNHFLAPAKQASYTSVPFFVIAPLHTLGTLTPVVYGITVITAQVDQVAVLSNRRHRVVHVSRLSYLST